MSIFEWSDSFLLRVPVIDEHHKHLVKLLNLSYDRFINNTDESSPDVLVSDLINYAGYHFRVEESAMEDCNYPFIAEHKLEHESFAQRALDLQSLLNDGNTALEMEVFHFLKDWLTDHILNADKKFGYFIHSSNYEYTD